MATIHKTMLLDLTNWDLLADASGNIAMATQPYSRAQDVSTALRLFKGELWYNALKGIPYFQQILGHMPPVSIVKAELLKAAMTVNGVTTAEAVLQATVGRNLTGQLQFIDIDNVTNKVGL
jgi:hypothetical protein